MHDFSIVSLLTGKSFIRLLYLYLFSNSRFFPQWLQSLIRTADVLKIRHSFRTNQNHNDNLANFIRRQQKHKKKPTTSNMWNEFSKRDSTSYVTELFDCLIRMKCTIVRCTCVFVCVCMRINQIKTKNKKQSCKLSWLQSMCDFRSSIYYEILHRFDWE